MDGYQKGVMAFCPFVLFLQMNLAEEKWQERYITGQIVKNLKKLQSFHFQSKIELTYL